MNKVILIPDSFKGTLSSSEICEVMERSIRRHFKDAKIVSIPVADGGEGSVDCFLAAMGGKRIYTSVKDAFMQDLKCCYGIFPEGKRAVIEMASCAGLPQAAGRMNPEVTSTYGVGQLVLHAAENGAENIILGLGGSSTNDGGCGAAAAVGVRFLDKNNREFIPTGGTLKDIADIDLSGVNPVLNKLNITAMCDIDNPMYGSSGAAHIFAPQKGADPSMVERLDNGLKHLSEVVRRNTGVDYSSIKGSGAAGALGYGMLAFFKAELKMGIETVLDTVNFDSVLKNADLVITGEGKIDSQSLRGKVVSGVSRRARKKGVPVLAVVGMIGENIEPAYEKGLTSVFSINTAPMDFEKSKFLSKENLEITMDNIMRFSSAMVNVRKY